MRGDPRRAKRLTVHGNGASPLRTRAIADAKIKTDKVDARTLAQLLATDFIPEVWVPDPATRALRGRIAQHRALVQQRTRLRNQIHAALIDRELSQTALTNADARLLCTIGGIGAVTALALVALIGPIERPPAEQAGGLSRT